MSVWSDQRKHFWTSSLHNGANQGIPVTPGPIFISFEKSCLCPRMKQNCRTQSQYFSPKWNLCGIAKDLNSKIVSKEMGICVWVMEKSLNTYQQLTLQNEWVNCSSHLSAYALKFTSSALTSGLWTTNWWLPSCICLEHFFFVKSPQQMKLFWQYWLFRAALWCLTFIASHTNVSGWHCLIFYAFNSAAILFYLIKYSKKIILA